MDNEDVWKSVAKSFVEEAIQEHSKGNYGFSLAAATMARGLYHRAGDEGGECGAASLCAIAQDAMETDFRRQAEEEGLPVTDANFSAMLREHSPHYYTLKGFADLCDRYGNLIDVGHTEKGARHVLEKEYAVRTGDEQALAYLEQEAGTALTNWEPWKGDPGVDVEKARRGIEAASHADIDGEYQEVRDELRRKLDELERWRAAL